VERFVEQFKKEAEKIKDDLESAAEYRIAEFKRRIEEILKGIEEAARELKPTYVFDLLERGGQAAAFDLTNETNRDEELSVLVGPYHVKMPKLVVPPGKHRALLLIIPK